MFSRRRISQNGSTDELTSNQNPQLGDVTMSGSMSPPSRNRSNHHISCTETGRRRLATTMLKWSSFAVITMVYFSVMFRPVDPSMFELTATGAGSIKGTNGQGILSPLEIVKYENDIVVKANESKRKKRLAEHAARVEAWKKQKGLEEQKKKNEKDAFQGVDGDGKNDSKSKSAQKNEVKLRGNDVGGDNELRDSEKDKQRRKLQKLYVLGRIASLWTMVLSVLLIYRYFCRRYFPRWSFSTTPITPFPGIRGHRNAMNSLRRARFEMLARRLNDERISNGANPISREALMLAFSRRDFNPNDYEQLLRLNEENGNVMLSSIGATEVSWFHVSLVAFPPSYPIVDYLG